MYGKGPFKYQILTLRGHNSDLKDTPPKTIKLILETVGYLQRIGPPKRFGVRQVPVSPLTITQIAEKTGINQQRLKKIIRDLADSQLIDVALQQTNFRKPISSPHQSDSIPRWMKRTPRTKIPKGLSPAEEFEFRVRSLYWTIPVAPRDVYLRYYRTELGQEWLSHYRKFPNSSKKLLKIRNRHRLSELTKTKWDWVFKSALNNLGKPSTTNDSP